MKKIQVLFIWNDEHHTNIDFRNASRGNIGIGGTDFLFGTISHELANLDDIEVTVLHKKSSNILADNIRIILKNSDSEIQEELRVNSHKFDFVVIRADARQLALIEAMPKNTKIVAWAHNHLRAPLLNTLGNESRVVAIVNVGREQMLLTRLSKCFHKSTWIDNPVYAPATYEVSHRSKRAVYLGALIPTKGFHRLARLWPKIKRLSPEAELDVIGSTDLYGTKSKSNEEYMASIMRYFDNKPEIFGVKFLGKLGEEKNIVLQSALVGLPNPTGFTETSCLSALEMSINGLALVAPRRWGFCDTVSNNISGTLTDNDVSYIKAVSFLLNNPEDAIQLGESGKQWVSDNFNYRKISEEWKNLFIALLSGNFPNKAFPKSPIGKYPHRMAYNLNLLGSYAQPLIDTADKLYGWKLKQ